MEFKFGERNSGAGHHEVIAVPSVAGGAFIVDHEERYGRRVYDQLKIVLSGEDSRRVQGGDFSHLHNHFEALGEHCPGVYKVIGKVARVAVQISQSDDVVSVRPPYVQELAPYSQT